MSEGLRTSTQPDVIYELGDVATRNAWLDATLNNDPNRPLPEIKLEVQDIRQRHKIEFDEVPPANQVVNHPYDIIPYKIINAGGEKVGFVDLATPSETNTDDPNRAFINNIKVFSESQDQPSERGKGYGPAAYLALMKSLPAGQRLKTHGMLREGSLKMWRQLVEKGVARQIPSDYPEEFDAFETVF